MPRSTRTRTQTTYADSDSSDPEDTPKAKNTQRPTKKKRVSDVFRPENGSPVNANDTRSPLKSVDINDDTAEKRRRRKSTKLSRPPMDDVDALRPADDGGARNHARANQLNVVEDAPIINVPLDVMSSNFEEWMKMATDNVSIQVCLRTQVNGYIQKINAANSWNFALIDYFHDMSLLRNVTDNSINFQKASCTLDGCVKIWTSRVDSVGTETGKLLSNLANEGSM
jgi:condensin complex subunit 2